MSQDGGGDEVTQRRLALSKEVVEDGVFTAPLVDEELDDFSVDHRRVDQSHLPAQGFR